MSFPRYKPGVPNIFADDHPDGLLRIILRRRWRRIILAFDSNDQKSFERIKFIIEMLTRILKMLLHRYRYSNTIKWMHNENKPHHVAIATILKKPLYVYCILSDTVTIVRRV